MELINPVKTTDKLIFPWHHKPMDVGTLNLFLKLIREDYKLSEAQVLIITRRLLADEQEFQRVWDAYKAKAARSGVDNFRPLLNDLLSHS